MKNIKCKKCGKEITDIRDIGFAQKYEHAYEISISTSGDLDYNKVDEQAMDNGKFFCMECGKNLPQFKSEADVKKYFKIK
jgi:DNA-directed RNA polymerase subunit RPC12/RpoP